MTDFRSDSGSIKLVALTEEQARTIALSTIAAMGEASETHLIRVLGYVDGALMEHGLIENLLCGHMAIVGFAPDGSPEFTITPAGTAHVEGLVAAARAPDSPQGGG